MIRILCWLTVPFVLAGSGGARAEEMPAGPSDTVRQLLSAIRESRNPDPQLGAAARTRANAALDLAGLGRKSLAAHWEQLDPAGQQEFLDLLSRLFEVRAYPKSAEFFKDLEVQFREESVEDPKATVSTTVSHPDEGRVDIDFRLSRTAEGWIVYEVYLDEVPMGANLRNQMRKVLREEGYPELLRRLREKLAEFEAEPGAPGPDGN